MSQIAWAPTIPDQWAVARLKDHVELTNGLAFDSDRFSHSLGVPLIRIRDLIAGSTQTHFDGDVPASVMAFPGDLLVGMDGDFNCVVWRGEPAAINQRVCRLRVHPTLAFRYLVHMLPSALRHLNELTYFTTVKHLSSIELLNMRIPLPPIVEQRVIADSLDRETARIDTLIEKTTVLRGCLAELRAAVIFLGVSGLLNQSADVHDPGIPWTRVIRRPWPRVRIKRVADLGTGHTPGRAHPEYWENCSIPWITTGEIAQVRDDRAEVITETREKISELGLKNSSAELHPKNTVVLCRTASAGYSAIMGDDMATSQDFVTWTCSDELLPRYLLMCLRAMRTDLLGRLAYGSTHKTIYFPDVEGLAIPLPTIREQEEVLHDIDARLELIDLMTDRLAERTRLLHERRQALVTAAITGQLPIA